MKFTPQAHMKIARIVLRRARAANGTKKLRLESLAHAHKIRAKQLQGKLKGMSPNVPNPVTVNRK
jgi:hypothetical protein